MARGESVLFHTLSAEQGTMLGDLMPMKTTKRAEKTESTLILLLATHCQ